MQSWTPTRSVALSATVLCLCLWLSVNGIVRTQGALERRHSTVTFSERTAVSCVGNVQFFVRKVSKDKCPRLMGVSSGGGTFYSCPG